MLSMGWWLMVGTVVVISGYWCEKCDGYYSNGYLWLLILISGYWWLFMVINGYLGVIVYKQWKTPGFPQQHDI